MTCNVFGVMLKPYSTSSWHQEEQDPWSSVDKSATLAIALIKCLDIVGNRCQFIEKQLQQLTKFWQYDSMTMTLSAAWEIPNPFPQSEPAQISSINLSCPVVWKTWHSLSLSANFEWQVLCDTVVYSSVCCCFNV